MPQFRHPMTLHAFNQSDADQNGVTYQLVPSDQDAEVDAQSAWSAVFSVTQSGGAASPTVEFASYIGSKAFGDEVELTIQRNQEEKKIKMILGKRPPELTDPRIEERFDADFDTWLGEGRTSPKE